jgi:hypothetical protein
MRYLIGFFSAFLIMYLFFKIDNYKNITQEPKIKPLRYSQSHIHYLVSDFIPKNSFRTKNKKTQSMMHEKNNTIKVIIMDNNAYWVRNNAFYMADMCVDGTVDKDTTRTVDIHTMSRVQLDKMLFIIDQLKKEEDDDSRSSGH